MSSVFFFLGYAFQKLGANLLEKEIRHNLAVVADIEDRAEVQETRAAEEARGETEELGEHLEENKEESEIVDDNGMHSIERVVEDEVKEEADDKIEEEVETDCEEEVQS